MLCEISRLVVVQLIHFPVRNELHDDDVRGTNPSYDTPHFNMDKTLVKFNDTACAFEYNIRLKQNLFFSFQL